MKLEVKCNASVELKGFFNLVDIECKLGDYQLEGDTLNGHVEIIGIYNQTDLDVNYDFGETVPYTIVFNTKNYDVHHLTVTNLVCSEIVNQGLECDFDIIIDYDIIEERAKKETIIDKLVEEEKIENESYIEEIVNDVEEEIDDNIMIEENNQSSNYIEDNNIDDIISNESSKNNEENDIVKESEPDFQAEDISIKEEIEEKYDSLLNKILESRDDNFLEEESNVQISTSDTPTKVDLRSINEKYDSYRVYYPSDESELESIANKEKVSIDKLYKQNSDFANKKRIIVK